ncbi:MAG: Na+/H+ antiporter NhaA [Acidimicrobiia bacterium]|nr:Na+/H+ antiporter NhaA [Acidimicrobiia bacterium]
MSAGSHHKPSDLTWIGQDRRLARRVGQPLAKFMAVEAASGILLIIATIAALVWANSAWHDAYEDFLHFHINVEIGPFHLEESFLHFVNDGLMAIFFFVVGLEIKRELTTGELRDPRAALLPAVAAVGGMVVPALLFVIVTRQAPEVDGWGIPMATDIAFAVGIVSLLGNRVPTQLKIFLLTLAIVDDIGAIAVIAIFYSSGIAFGWLGIAVGLLVTVFVLQRAKVWYTPLYVLLGAICWYAMLESGVHATIAGVALGLMTPARPLQRSIEPARVVDEIGSETFDGHTYRRVDLYIRETVPVAERLQTLLHPFTSFLVIPIFALVNAGIVLSGDGIREAASSTVTLGIIVGLVAGKAVGISAATYLAVKSKACTLPNGVTWPQVVAVALLAGIGFTVALFITSLAYSDEAIVTQAKMGILVASTLAAVLGAGLLHHSTRENARSRRADDDEGSGLFEVLQNRLEPIAESVMAAPETGPESEDGHAELGATPTAEKVASRPDE